MRMNVSLVLNASTTLASADNTGSASMCLCICACPCMANLIQQPF
jgi:hypothetical protein